ncbi:hypothetical protein LYSIN_04033 [Lysinibacillus sphaericus]|uniref:Uncharacterized protein n=1 Tax=Lysinibacillus sphaericus TaxID=1421 RepID=A0A2S5CU89_LYSSH|nr:hypothetical protein LYSIN_04033 [Lysinibacillus sphaericus]
MYPPFFVCKYFDLLKNKMQEMLYEVLMLEVKKYSIT